jgi:hypothetical protein
MGCDYYIIKRLKIEHSDGVDIIELDRQRCYFSEYENNSNYDSDDSNYDSESMYEHYLKVTYVPRVLYEHDNWKNETIKKKYIDMVYEKLKKYNNAFGNIHEIIKEEVRYFR